MDDVAIRPRCYECLSYDVAVKVIDPMGFEHWLCQADWDGYQELHEKIMAVVSGAADAVVHHRG